MIQGWDKAREEKGNISFVIKLIQKRDFNIRGKRGKPYIFNIDGTQRRQTARGEGKIEATLLSPYQSNKSVEVVKNGKVIKKIDFVSNAVVLGSRRKGNVIADLIGIDEKGSPVAGEVKINHKNPWYAVVEGIEQVALMRADRKNLLESLQEKTHRKIRGVGSWGIVIAPEKYWKKPECQLADKLIKELRKKTKIRICCVSYDSKKPKRLEVVCGLPPLTR